MAYWLLPKQQRTPSRGTRRARHWRKLEFGERIVDKYGRVTGWEVASPPYRQSTWAVLASIDVFCTGCGNVYTRFLNDIVQGKSQRCRDCHRAGRKPGRVSAAAE